MSIHLKKRLPGFILRFKIFTKKSDNVLIACMEMCTQKVAPFKFNNDQMSNFMPFSLY